MNKKLLCSVAIFILLSAVCKGQTNTFPPSGSAGIGTLNPLTVLDVRGGNILVKNLANETNESVVMIDHSLSFGPYKNFGTSLRTFTENAEWNIYALQLFTQDSFLTGQTEKLRITGNGNVGIGTTSPIEKLSVNGKIRAHEIKVEAANWPDYVFDQDYKILGLQELDAYIKANKHLPEMPSAGAVEKNGIELGDLVKKLLKNQEELTLHLIEKDKALKAESAVNFENKKRISKTEKELAELKELVNRLMKK